MALYGCTPPIKLVNTGLLGKFSLNFVEVAVQCKHTDVVLQLNCATSIGNC